jgi:iron(III) transport system permease protein
MNLLKPRLRLVSGEILEYIVIYTVALILIAFLLIPLIIMIVQSILKDPLILRGSLIVTIENYLNIFSSDLFRRALINSFIVSISTLIITTMLGLLIAFLIVRTDLPLSSIIHKLIYLPIFLGPLLLSFGWAELASSKGSIGSALKSLGIGINVLSIEGIIFVTSIWLMPYSYTFMAAGLRSISQELELSARISGSNMMRAFIAITIPLLYPFILSSSYLVFVLSFEQFTIPMVLGYSEGIFTLITYILLLRDLSVPPPYGAIAALGVIVTSIITIFIVINNMILKRAYRLITITGRGQIMKPINLGIFRWPLATLVLIYIVISSVAPIGALIYRSLRDPGGVFSLINYYDLFLGGMDIARRAIINSVVLSIFAAALTLLLSILIVYSRLWGVRIFRYLDWLFWIPIAMPGLILGIGFLWGFLLLKLWFLYPTLLGLLIAYTVRFFPTGNRMASSIITQISPELDHQASICGATLFTRLRKIIMPIGKLGYMGVFSILVATYINEISTSLYLVGPGSEVSSVIMLQLWLHGFMDLLFALASFQALMVFLIIYIILGILRIEPSISVGVRV